jgi:tRNA U34 5-methylaminomethyl-2-thiouridine-forming methyltransferase MnmC
VIERGRALYERLGHGPWEPWHTEVRRALSAACSRPGSRVELGARGTLELVLGDARATLPRARPAEFDAVFLDPFSPRRAGELWEEPFLAALAARMARGAWLATYSAAFRVRLALARAGLRVGRGPRVGAKGEGTLATPDQQPPELPSRLVRRLSRRLSGPLAGA